MPVYSIAMVAACPFPANHGTPAAIKEMSEELARRGHSVRVVTYPLHDDIPVAGIEIDRVSHVGRNREVNVGPSYQRLVFDAMLAIKLFQVLRRHEIDVIHAHNYEAMLIGGVVGRLTGVPVIYNAINTMIDELPTYDFFRLRLLASGLAKILDYVVPRMADIIISDTEELRSFISGQGVRPERVVTIHSGVRPEMFQNGNGARVRERFAISDAPLILYTGTFDHFQGLDYLMAAFRIVHQRKPTARLLLVSSTASRTRRTKYERMATEFGFGSQFAIASSTLEELPDFLAAADVAVVPRPNSPGIPTKLLNYMAAGTAIVSFRRAATILQHEVTAFLVDDVTAASLAEGILTVLDKPGLAEKMRANVKSFVVGRFDWPSIATKLEAIYERVTQKSHAVLVNPSQVKRAVEAQPAVSGSNHS
jgi:1,2-diacylglycerol 3-alpha-glucosyltransferase